MEKVAETEGVSSHTTLILFYSHFTGSLHARNALVCSIKACERQASRRPMTAEKADQTFGQIVAQGRIPCPGFEDVLA